MMAVGLLRFGLDLREVRGLALLGDGGDLALTQRSFSRLVTEFLVRWRMLCEKRLAEDVAELAPLVVPIDCTVTPGAAATCRARHALTGVTLWAEQLEAENKPEVLRFLRTFRQVPGAPVLRIRDQSATFREALNEEFPGVPQQEDR
ncbi:MAG: hypothetical protein ACREDK_04260 [Thermoplasmata archaeon]